MVLRSPILTATIAALLVAALWAVTAPPGAQASRAPTASEAKAIRAAALRSLTGTGWRVSGIRVSRVSGTYRYAKASVERPATGVGGLMLLRGRNNRWTRRFLGTDGFCDAPLPERVLNDFGFRC